MNAGFRDGFKKRNSDGAAKRTEETMQKDEVADPYKSFSFPQSVCSRNGIYISYAVGYSRPYNCLSLCIDHLKKKNCSKNPWCVYGLGEMKEGIWKDDLFVEKRCGKSLNSCLRDIDTTTILPHPPCGLRNLGATCYLNVLMQVSAAFSQNSSHLSITACLFIPI
jgi:hypothetical protein